jgi:YVTN family beta-propeller protein
MKLSPLASAIAGFIFAVALSPLDAALPLGAGDPVVDVANGTIVKLKEADGSVVWSVPVGNDGALAVDPADLSVYTAIGGHATGTDGTTYKFNANGTPSWTNSISLSSYCDFQFVTNAAVDAGSGNPGVVWSESGCFGALAKSDRTTGLQQWSVLTYDIGRPSIDPGSGQIYSVTNAGLNYDAETIYNVTAGGTLSYATSCEGYTDLNPADGMLYRGGGDAQSRGCGTTLFQMNQFALGATNWSVDLSSYITSLDALAVQPWQGGYVYAASVASSKVVVVDPATRSVVTSFNTAIPPKFIALDPNGGNVYVANDQQPYVIAYGPTGALVWINPNLGGNVTNLATPKGLVGVSPGPTPTPNPTPDCPAPTVRITSDRTSIHKGASATITFFFGKATIPCKDVTVHFHVGGKAKPNIDFTLTDVSGQDATVTGAVINGPLTLHNLYTSRVKPFRINITLLKDKAYYIGNPKVTVEILAN